MLAALAGLRGQLTIRRNNALGWVNAPRPPLVLEGEVVWLLVLEGEVVRLLVLEGEVVWLLVLEGEVVRLICGRLYCLSSCVKSG